MFIQPSRNKITNSTKIQKSETYKIANYLLRKLNPSIVNNLESVVDQKSFLINSTEPRVGNKILVTDQGAVNPGCSCFIIHLLVNIFE